MKGLIFSSFLDNYIYIYHTSFLLFCFTSVCNVNVNQYPLIIPSCKLKLCDV